LAIFALVILSAPSKALSEDDLLYLMTKLCDAMRAAPYSRDVTMPEGDAREHLRLASMVAKVERFQHPGGDVIYMDEREGLLLTYYRNNVLHLVAVPSLVASFFQHNDRMLEEDLIKGSAQLYPFLRAEFFLRWEDKEARRVIQGVIDALIGQGLLFRDGPYVHRPEVTSRDLTSLRILSRALGQTLERYAISTALLARHGEQGEIDRKEFETQCQLMAQRISILNGVNEPEFSDKNLFRVYIDQLEEQGFAKDLGEGRLRVDPRVQGIAANAVNLLSGDLRQSIQRLTLGLNGSTNQDASGPSKGI
jgi:glycerol-3-phosphate O-acyltransferase